MSDKNTAHAPTWKNPSVATMQRYGLTALPDDFVPTEQEQALLDMYETVRQYERTAKKIREESARQKLEASKQAFEQKQAPKKKRKRKKKAETAEGEENEEDEDEEEEASDEEMSDAQAAAKEEDDDDDEDDEDARAEREQEEYERREAKLERLRQQVEQKKQTAERKQEELRAEHLDNSQDDVMAGVSVRKKIKIAPAAASSLIKNLKPGATPVHDFSSSYELERGQVMFPTEDMEADEFWSPPEEKRIPHPTEGALEMILDNFDLQAAENGTGKKNHSPLVRLWGFSTLSFLTLVFVSFLSVVVQKVPIQLPSNTRLRRTRNVSVSILVWPTNTMITKAFSFISTLVSANGVDSWSLMTNPKGLGVKQSTFHSISCH